MNSSRRFLRHSPQSSLLRFRLPYRSFATIDEANNGTVVARFDYAAIRNELLQCWMKAEAATPSGSTLKGRYCCFTYDDAKREYMNPSSRWHWLDREMSSNVAGETGAVHIYKGALAAMKIRSTSPEAIEFCQSHMANESSHLRYFEAVVPEGKQTKFLPIWRFAGWALGFLPTIIGGNKALYVTVEAVETFVEEHFQEQIVPLKKPASGQHTSCQELIRLLEYCCEDEVHHKEDAAKHLLDGDDKDFHAWWVNPWSLIVRQGSAIAAEVARRV